MQNYSIAGGGFHVEAHPGVPGVTQLHLSAHSADTFTGAGVLAVINQIYTNLNTGTPKNMATLERLAPTSAGLQVKAGPSGASYPILTGDVVAQVAALATIVQTAANVAA